MHGIRRALILLVLPLLAAGCPNPRRPRAADAVVQVDADIARACAAEHARDPSLARCHWTKAPAVQCSGAVMDESKPPPPPPPPECVCNGCERDDDCGDGLCVEVGGACQTKSYVCVHRGDPCWDPEACAKQFEGMGICTTAGPFKAQCIYNAPPP